MKVFHITLFFFFLAKAVNAQQEFNLQQCIETALNNNIKLKQSKLLLKSANIDVTMGMAAMLPNINGSFSENFNFGRNIDPVTNGYISNNTQSTNMGVNSTLILFNGFQLMNNLKLAKINYAASGTDVLAMQNDLSLQVAAAFLQVMFAEDNVTNAQSQLELTISQHKRAEVLVEAGKVAQSTLYELDAQQANDEYNLQVADNAVVSAKLLLIQLMELPATTKYKIVRPNIALPVAENYDVNVIYEQSLKNRPEVMSAEMRKKGAELNRKIMLGTLSPRLTVSAGLSTLYSNKYKAYEGRSLAGYSLGGITKNSLDTVLVPVYLYDYRSVSFNDQLNQNFGRYVSFGLAVPIFNNLKVYGSVQKAKYNIYNQELNIEQVKNNLLKSIQQAVTDVEAAKAKYASAQKSLAAQNTNFTNMELRYNQGLSSFLDYITAKNNKARAEVNLEQAKYDLILKSKIIDFYRGINISL